MGIGRGGGGWLVAMWGGGGDVGYGDVNQEYKVFNNVQKGGVGSGGSGWILTKK